VPPEEKSAPTGATSSSTPWPPTPSTAPPIVEKHLELSVLISATFNRSRLSGQRRPAIESAGRNIYISKARPAVSVAVHRKIPASQPAAATIDYAATDSTGLGFTSTRIVLIEPAASAAADLAAFSTEATSSAQ
jgi:hypothetical protein